MARATPTENEYRGLIEEGSRLGPWNYDIELKPGLSTREFEAAPPTDPGSQGRIRLVSSRERFQQLLLDLYPDGLEGRSVLDCACNCGGHLFWAKELGAGRCFGFDVREHWINQARFLLEHRDAPSDDMRFEVHDLYDVPSLGLEPFDLVLFLGIFYHLPDPMTGLKVAADLAKETMIVLTATQAGYPDNLLVQSPESTTMLKSGVHGLAWFPTGIDVMAGVLGWAGFPETRTERWRRRAGQRVRDRDELRLVAAREPGALAAYDDSRARRAQADPALALAESIPLGATVLVASGGDEAKLELGARRAWHFPQAPDGGWTADPPAVGPALTGQVDRLRDEGAEYLLLPPDGVAWLEGDPELASHLEDQHELVASTGGCRLFRLRPPGGAG
jgi:SAM-dependent methyltransferase